MIYYNSCHAPVAQLDRVLGYEPNGREFESLRVHQNQKKREASSFLFPHPSNKQHCDARYICRHSKNYTLAIPSQDKLVPHESLQSMS